MVWEGGGKIEIITLKIADKGYPENLRGLSDAPKMLYLKGQYLKSDGRAVAIVGSRKMTAYGRGMAYVFSRELAKKGITIISGLARGVDTEAHLGALDAGGRTIAVMGSGLESIYPPENAGLAKRIIDSGQGVLVSEYPEDYPVSPSNFAARNRIISGLARGVLVIEGAQKSGTLITAGHAAAQGREVFAVPGPITSPLSAAPLFLIRNGAKIVTCPQDILDELPDIC